MARFEMSLLLAVVDENEIETVEHEIMCFCKDRDDISEVHMAAERVITQMLGIEEGEILFGSATIDLDMTTLSITFKNQNADEDEINQIMDLILDTPETTIH